MSHHGYGGYLLYDSLLFSMKHSVAEIPPDLSLVNMTLVQQ